MAGSRLVLIPQQDKSQCLRGSDTLGLDLGWIWQMSFARKNVWSRLKQPYLGGTRPEPNVEVDRKGWMRRIDSSPLEKRMKCAGWGLGQGSSTTRTKHFKKSKLKPSCKQYVPSGRRGNSTGW